MMERAERNRTLTLSKEDEIRLSERLCVSVEDEFINRTINADLLCVIDKLPQGFADLIIIDPPYNLTKEFGKITFKASTHEEYTNYICSWFGKVVRCLKPNGSLYMCGDWRSTAVMQQVIEEYLTILNRITWQREKGRGALMNWKNGMEDIWFAVADDRQYYFNVEAVKQKRRVIAPYKINGVPKDWEETEYGNFRLTYPSNFWDDISIPYWSMPENTDHPTQKPEKLIAKLILASCPKGGIVFDPFLGSGTTSVVAKKLERKYVGVEVNKEYCLWAEKRLEMAETDKTIQGYTDDVFWERNTASLQNITQKRNIKAEQQTSLFS